MDINNFGKLVEDKIRVGLDPYEKALNFMHTESEKQKQEELAKAAASISVEEINVGEVEEPAIESTDVKKETEDFVI